jgi:hypothetical protein
MELTAVKIAGSVPVTKVDVASWEAGFSSSLEVKDPTRMVNLSAVTVYQIVTVVVSCLRTSL